MSSVYESKVLTENALGDELRHWSTVEGLAYRPT